ncbi:hypothetical protein O181_024666 [Austropuccinia psidii MF-1]|uniref:Uncharacterized protein n=1 Tax=Austropuccinia psidii MF-1 TaxID=1389203 RepID=A0A9Q3CH53_9BASI|nr:hypothetical protein [Austropuccinia psidii MF-1]
MSPPTTTPFFPIVSSPSQSLNPQLLLQAHPNDIPSPDTPRHPSRSMSPHDTSIELPHPSCDDVTPKTLKPPHSNKSNSSTPLHLQTPCLNHTLQQADCEIQTPPVLVEDEQAPTSQPTSTPNFECSIFSNPFCSQFYNIFQIFNSGRPTQAKYQMNFEAISSLIKWHLQALVGEKPAQGHFDINQCPSSYTQWIKELSDHS